MNVENIRESLQMIRNGLVFFTPCTPEEATAKGYARQGCSKIQKELDALVKFSPLLCPECGNEYTGAGCPCHMYGDR